VTTVYPVQLTPADTPAVVEVITDLLPGWVVDTPVKNPIYGRWEWTDGDTHQRIELSTWPSYSVTYLCIAYRCGGAERSHLVLRELDQVREYLALLRLTPALVAAAVLTPDAEVLS